MAEKEQIPILEERIKELNKELAKQIKIKESLINRIEQGIDYNVNSASLFETNIYLKQAVKNRTNELEKINNKLKEEINEKAKAELLLRASENKFRTFFEIPIVGFVITDTKGKWVHFNDKFADMLGYTREELLQKKISDLQLPEDYQFDIQYFTQLRNNQISGIDVEKKYIKKDGNFIYTSMSARIINEGSGDNEYFAAVVKDISDQKTAIENLKLSEERFRSFTENNPVQICSFNPDGILTYVNPALCSFMKAKKENLLGKKYYDFIDLQSKKDFAIKRIARLSPNNPIETHEQVFTDPDGDMKWQQWTNLAFYNKNGEIINYLAIGIDITDRILYESQILAAKENAEKSEKLKSAFLAQMSHEIRSPLYGILSYVSLIKDHINGTKTEDIHEIQTYFSAINVSTNRLIRTIDLILNMSEIQTKSYSPNFGTINVKKIMNNIYSEYELKASGKNLKFTLSFETDNLDLFADEYSFTQIFVNIIDNAIKYTENGYVLIKVIDQDKNNLIVEVSDTGIGISEEFQKKLFTPFTQEETGYTRRFGGNGLGLAIVKNYCEINSATITVKSKKQEGTQFSVSFIR
ncbi:MAG: PAS domain S-box protein [bacterium]